jgi:NADPH2:quinone reductase
MTTMRAAVVREYGGYDRVQVEDMPKPRLKTPKDVMLRVRACGLSDVDLLTRQGLPSWGLKRLDLPFISGVDVVGEIVEVGNWVSSWREGDRVAVYPSRSCGYCPTCVRGEDTMCHDARIFIEDSCGGLADYCCVPAGSLESLGQHVSFLEAAAMPLVYTTAWRVVKTAQLRPLDRVLILGATDALGSAVLSLTRRFGCYVYATAKGFAGTNALKALGANRAIDIDREDFGAVIQEESGGHGVDLVVNSLGGATWQPAVRSLAIGGRMVVCGASMGDSPHLSIRELYQSYRQVLGVPMGNREDFREVLDLLDRGELKPVVHGTLPLEDTAEGHRLIEAGEAFGNVIVDVAIDA